MAADWVKNQEGNCPPEWRAGRIADSLSVIAGNLDCPELQRIARDLVASLATPGKREADDLLPLAEFLAGVRRAMPDSHRQHEE